MEPERPVRRVRVCLYGGTDLDAPATRTFISAVARRTLETLPAVIVTGGFLHSAERPQAISTDAAALQGAREYAKTHPDAGVEDCFEAWIPEPALDARLSEERVVRMSEADGITLRVVRGRTDLGRRLAMVAGVDVVMTISGKVHTELVIEQALELGVPVLPIPDAGGDSKKMLDRYRSRIAKTFDDGALDRCLAAVSAALGADDADAAAAAAVELIATAKVGRCLVLLPYDRAHNALYESTIEPAIARHMIPDRLDHRPSSTAIYTTFADAVHAASAVLADITRLNENVMYEVGYAHGCGLTPLIYSREARRLQKLPVYFRTLNVRVAPDAAALDVLIDEYLRSLKGRRRVRELSSAPASPAPPGRSTGAVARPPRS